MLPAGSRQRNSEQVWQSSPYNGDMKLPALVNGRAPRRKPVISTRESLAGEPFRGYPDHHVERQGRRDEALSLSSRFVEGWF
jgi:hypothetical protein